MVAPYASPWRQAYAPKRKAERKDHSRSSLKFLFHVRRFPSSGSRSAGKPGSILRLRDVQSAVESISGGFDEIKATSFNMILQSYFPEFTGSCWMAALALL
ncbi:MULTISPECIES: hypothetical protein [unclassified Mesorhizobium]